MVRILCIFLATLFANHFLFSKSATESEDVRANFSEREKAWWAIQPIGKNNLKFSANPVDYFIQEKLDFNELKLSKELIRFKSITPKDAGAINFLRKNLKLKNSQTPKSKAIFGIFPPISPKSASK